MSDRPPPAAPRHVPVLAAEVLEFLEPAPGQTVVDATVGGGGHARRIADRLRPGGRLIGLDRDPAMLSRACQMLEVATEGVRLDLVHANFDTLPEVLRTLDAGPADSVLADLGVSSDQLDDPERGLSFQKPGPLDMRLDPTRGEPARTLLRRLSERELADIFWKYGEERFSRRIARRIVETRKARPLQTTDQFADLVRHCVPRPRHGGHRIDPATRAFQALRIAVNDELGALDRFLAALPACVKAGGRAVIISFQSLEDRRVKQALRDRQNWENLTRKPVQAGDEELRENPRARSAKLRAARRTPVPG